MREIIRIFAAALPLLLLCLPATAQLVDATKLGDAVTLGGSWRFRTGDDQKWAQRDFDDSHWQLVTPQDRATPGWLGNRRGFMWYRIRVQVQDNYIPLAILLETLGPYEIFVDGQRIGSTGVFPPGERVTTEMTRVYPLPPIHNTEIQIAVRFWIWPVIARANIFPGEITLASQRVAQELYQKGITDKLTGDIAYFLLDLVWLLLIMGLVSLFSMQRERDEYLWLAAAGLAVLAHSALVELVSFGIISNQAFVYPNSLCTNFAAVFVIEFAFHFLKQPMPRWLRIYQFSIPLLIIFVAVTRHSGMSNGTYNAIRLIWYTPYWVFLPSLLLWRYWKGNKEAGLLAVPLCLLFLNEFSGTLGWVTYNLHIRQSQAPFIPDLRFGLVVATAESLSQFLFLLSVGALILYRFHTTRQDQLRAHAELEAGRSMQEVMLSSRWQNTPGFLVDSVYVPAQELGGDFFQVFPGPDGSLLVVIGDVSGKGMKAAMLVSMILGILLRISKETRDPGRFLSELNSSLLGHMDGRFATCCCALFYPDGRIDVANAGHLNPYCNGKEIEVSGGLPLGVAADVEYQCITVQVKGRVVFLSDGVVEARSRTGELYGFERTRGISIQPVTEIAETAQRFGQEDDITVVGIAFA